MYGFLFALADAMSSEIREQSFRRVIELAGLPEVPMTEGAVSVDRFLKIRDSSEAREFRGFPLGPSTSCGTTLGVIPYLLIWKHPRDGTNRDAVRIARQVPR